jgi:hypothetical protein
VITRAHRLTAILLALLAVSACTGGPRDTYTQNAGSYLRLPGEWELFTGEELVRSQDPEGELADGIEMRGFALDSDDPSVVLNSTDKLGGLLLSTAIPDGVTAEADRSVIITNLSELLATGEARLVEDFISFDAGNGVVGERATFDVPDADGDVMRLTQLTVTDEDRTRVWVLLVGCSTVCHERQSGLVENITTTWKVEPKR